MMLPAIPHEKTMLDLVASTAFDACLSLRHNGPFATPERRAHDAQV